MLPGGYAVDWLAAGTYDRSVGLSLFTLQVTHKIEENTDVERDYIVETVSAASPEVEVEVIDNFSTGYHSRNGGGDLIITDGNLPIIDADGSRCPRPRRWNAPTAGTSDLRGSPSGRGWHSSADWASCRLHCCCCCCPPSTPKGYISRAAARP